MKLSTIESKAALFGHKLVRQVGGKSGTGTETKYFTAGSLTQFVSIDAGPGAFQFLAEKKGDKDIKEIRVGGTGRVTNLLKHPAIIDGPRKATGEFKYGTWPQQINLNHPEAEAALEFVFSSMTGVELKPAVSPEEQAKLEQAGMEFAAGN